MTDAASDWAGKAEAVARDVLVRHAADVDRKARWPNESVDALRAGGFLGLTCRRRTVGPGPGRGRSRPCSRG